jgi:hypothetical protein
MVGSIPTWKIQMTELMVRSSDLPSLLLFFFISSSNCTEESTILSILSQRLSAFNKLTLGDVNVNGTLQYAKSSILIVIKVYAHATQQVPNLC